MELTSSQIVVIFFGGGGILAGIIGILSFIAVRLDKRRERIDKEKTERKTLADADLANTAEIKRIDSDNRDKASAAIWKLYEDAKVRIDELEKELGDFKQTDTLSRPTVTRIYQTFRKLGKQMSVLDSMLTGENEKREMDILWQKYDELEKSLP